MEKDAQWYADHFGVPFEEALYRLQMQGPIGELNATLLEQEEESFAGLWLQNVPEYQVFVAFTKKGLETIQPYIKDQPYEEFVKVQSAEHTLAALQKAQEEIFSNIVSLGIEATSGIDVANNRITVEVLLASQLDTAVQKADISLPTYVQVVEVEGLPIPELNDYAGLPQNKGTSGYIVYDVTGNKYHSTAAHIDTMRVYLFPDTPNKTRLPYKYGSRRWFGNYDYQLHYLPANITPKPWATDTDPDSTPYYRIITAWASRILQFPNSTACHYGKTTGYSCGTIQNNDKCLTVREIEGCKWVEVTGANHDNGDSGGPWYYGGTAYGIHSAGAGNYSYYMPVDNMLDHGYLVWTQQ